MAGVAWFKCLTCKIDENVYTIAVGDLCEKHADRRELLYKTNIVRYWFSNDRVQVRSFSAKVNWVPLPYLDVSRYTGKMHVFNTKYHTIDLCPEAKLLCYPWTAQRARHVPDTAFLIMLPVHDDDGRIVNQDAWKAANLRICQIPEGMNVHFDGFTIIHPISTPNGPKLGPSASPFTLRPLFLL